LKICVIIPSYNEKNGIKEVVKTIFQKGLDVVVVDDGSSDNSADLAKQGGATVIIHKINMGKGRSLQDGFDYAIDRNYDAVITLDGDGQHRPEEIGRFIDKYEKEKPSIIIGNRMKDAKNMPALRRGTNIVMSYIVSKICKQNIPDSQCGYRLISADVLRKIKLLTSRYDAESEILIKASRMRFRIDSVPISTVYEGQSSQINPVVDTVRFIKMLIRILKGT